MTSLLLLALLVAEASAYTRWAMHAIAEGAPAWWFILGAPIAYFLPIVVLVAIWFALVWIWRTPRRAAAQLDFAGSVKLFIGEVLAVAASWPLIALHRLFMREPDATKGKKLADFLRWALSDGQKDAPGLDYAPLPSSLVTKLMPRIDSIAPAVK